MIASATPAATMHIPRNSGTHRENLRVNVRNGCETGLHISKVEEHLFLHARPQIEREIRGVVETFSSTSRSTTSGARTRMAGEHA